MRKKLTPEEKAKKRKTNWNKILNGQRRIGSPRGSTEQWQKAFRMRMLLGMDEVDVNSNVILDYFGLEAEYTKDQLSKARRRKIFKLHPDRGGFHEEVLECNKLYEELLRRL